jgi:hypothetical protein
MTALGVDLLSRKKNDHPRAVFVINRGHPAPNQRLKNKLRACREITQLFSLVMWLRYVVSA